MAALLAAPPRTPSPKVRIHRSQSFDYSPSSKSIRSTTSITPIDDSPYSKSTSAIPFAGALATMNTLRTRSIMLNKGLNISDESMSSGVTSEDEMSLDEEPESPMSSTSSRESEYSLFSSPSSPAPSAAASQRHEPPAVLPSPHNTLQITHLSPPRPTRNTHSRQPSAQLDTPTCIPVSPYQDPATPMLDPWLVRMVLDMYDVRGFDWMMIAEPLQRCWGVRTTSAEVLGILVGNGRVGGRVWWD